MSWFGGARRPPGTVPPGVRAFHAGLAGYRPTPLTELPVVAAELGVGRVLVKDESRRLGLPAFKVLGVSWAVHRLALPVPSRLVTATDGNHGRALARTARVLGHHAHVVVPRGIATTPILGEGARVTEVDGDYDQAVRTAAALAAEPGSVLVQDTAWPGYEQIPGWIVIAVLNPLPPDRTTEVAAGQPATTSAGLEVTVTTPAPFEEPGYGPLTCTTVSYRNGGSGTADLNLLDWTLQGPQGDPVGVELIFQLDEALDGVLAPGASTSERLCFRGYVAGRHVLSFDDLSQIIYVERISWITELR